MSAGALTGAPIEYEKAEAYPSGANVGADGAGDVTRRCTLGGLDRETQGTSVPRPAEDPSR